VGGYALLDQVLKGLDNRARLEVADFCVLFRSTFCVLQVCVRTQTNKQTSRTSLCFTHKEGNVRGRRLDRFVVLSHELTMTCVSNTRTRELVPSTLARCTCGREVHANLFDSRREGLGQSRCHGVQHSVGKREEASIPR